MVFNHYVSTVINKYTIHFDSYYQRGVVSERNNDVKTFVGIEAVS